MELGSRSGGGRRVLAAHPHHPHWLAMRSLCEDGVALVKGARGGSYSQINREKNGEVRRKTQRSGGTKKKRRRDPERRAPGEGDPPVGDQPATQQSSLSQGSSPSPRRPTPSAMLSSGARETGVKVQM